MFYDYCRLFRVCWFSGRYGGGKSLLAVRTAFWLVEHNYAVSIVANMSLSLPGFDLVRETDLAGVRKIENAAIVFDEAWLDVQGGADRKVLSDWLAFLRHRNQFLLMPSVLRLKQQMSFFRVSRLFNFLPLGVNLWLYEFHVSNAGVKERGKFFLSPKRWFGSYDSEPKKVQKGVFWVYERQAVG